MNTYQIRGATGIAPRKNRLAEVYSQSRTLPSLKAYEYDKAAQERSLGLQERSVDNMKEAQRAADSDRKRGLWLQGGMLGVNAYRAADDAGLIDKGKDLLTSAFTSDKVIGDSLSGFAGQSEINNMAPWTERAVDTVSDWGGEAVDMVGDAGSWIKDNAIDPAADYISGLFA